MKTRIEANDQGELYIVLPDEVVDDLMLEEGEPADVSLEEGYIQIYFG